MPGMSHRTAREGTGRPPSPPGTGCRRARAQQAEDLRESPGASVTFGPAPGRSGSAPRVAQRASWWLRPGQMVTDDRTRGGKREMVMRARVYHGPGVKAWEDVPRPEVAADTDAIVRVDATTICGTDLHILKGDVPAVTDGRILGHEAVGTVDAVGSGVKTVKVGDRVLVSCISACGTCRFCREGHAGQCLGGGGWILGHKIDGTQAEYVRVPFADTSTYPLPAGSADEDILMLADILPTAYEVGVLNGAVQPGDVVR